MNDPVSTKRRAMEWSEPCCVVLLLERPLPSKPKMESGRTADGTLPGSASEKLIVEDVQSLVAFGEQHRTTTLMGMEIPQVQTPSFLYRRATSHTPQLSAAESSSSSPNKASHA